MIGRFLRNEVDCPADRVAAEQRPLRPAQNFNALQVDKVEHRPDAARDINPVDINADAGICMNGEIELTQPAQENRRSGRAARNRRSAEQDEVGRRIGQFGDTGQTALLDEFTADRRNRDRRALQRFTALAGGHDDIADIRTVVFDRRCRAGLRQRNRWRQ